MADDYTPLTDDERAELQELRAEKARRQEAERARRERAELERLRAEKAQAAARPQRSRASQANGQPQRAGSQSARSHTAHAQEPAPQATQRVVRRCTVTPEEAEQIERDRQTRERNAKIMEPDEDLNMPMAQKIVLVAVLAAALIAILAIVFGPH